MLKKILNYLIEASLPKSPELPLNFGIPEDDTLEREESPSQDPVNTLTDTPWGRDLARMRAGHPAKGRAAAEKVGAWAILFNMGRIERIPSAFYPHLQKAQHGGFDTANHQYALVQMTLMEVHASAEDISAS